MQWGPQGLGRHMGNVGHGWGCAWDLLGYGPLGNKLRNGERVSSVTWELRGAGTQVWGSKMVSRDGSWT